MELGLVEKLKLMNRAILVKRLVFSRDNNKLPRVEISDFDIANLRIALNTSDDPLEFLELADLL